MQLQRVHSCGCVRVTFWMGSCEEASKRFVFVVPFMETQFLASAARSAARKWEKISAARSAPGIFAVSMILAALLSYHSQVESCEEPGETVVSR